MIVKMLAVISLGIAGITVASENEFNTWWYVKKMEKIDFSKPLGIVAADNILSKVTLTDLNEKVEGQTPLHYAIDKRMPVVALLLMNLADINLSARNYLGETPLITAARNQFGLDTPLVGNPYEENGALIAHLLFKEVNVNAQAYNGFTALHYAALNGSEAYILLLLQHSKINPTLTDAIGQTPLDLLKRFIPTQSDAPVVQEYLLRKYQTLISLLDASIEKWRRAHSKQLPSIKS